MVEHMTLTQREEFDAMLASLTGRYSEDERRARIALISSLSSGEVIGSR